MIGNEKLFKSFDQTGLKIVQNRDAILDQLCDNQSAFESCVKKVLEHNEVQFDPEKLYAFGDPNGSNVNDEMQKFVLKRISIDGFTDTQVVDDWLDGDRVNGWPIYYINNQNNLNGTYLAELKRTNVYKNRFVPLFVNKQWKVPFDLECEYRNVLYDNLLKDMIEKNKQIIFTGAPGTGKTFGIRKAIDRLISETSINMQDQGDDTITIPARTKFVQFHSSYDYSDFVEGLRPVSLAEGQNPTFVRMDGIFMEFCRGVAQYNFDILSRENEITDFDDWYNKCRLSANASAEEKATKKAIKDKIQETQFYFVIDEINRADIGKVFGELMFGLEEDYRGIENRFATQYSNLSTYHRVGNSFEPYAQEDDIFAKGFFIPENVHIVGSMNNIDRSVDSFDFALRRRFRWHEVTAKDAMLPVLIGSFTEKQGSYDPVKLNKLCEYIKKLNSTISDEGKQFGLNESYHIGPAYFKNFVFGTDDENRAKREEIWDAGIKHILREYVNGRNEDKVEDFMRDCREAFIEGKA